MRRSRQFLGRVASARLQVIQIGSGITVPISRASATFTHDVSLTLGGQTVSATGVATSATLTPNLANFCSQLPNSTSGTATVKVVTKNGGTVIGTTTKSHVIYVPTNIVPTISSISSVERNSIISNLSLGANNFAQSKSVVRATLGVNHAYGAWATQYIIRIEGVAEWSHNGNVFDINLELLKFLYGDQTISYEVVDSRGRRNIGHIGIKIHEYRPPRIKSFIVSRVGNGTSLAVHKDIEAVRIANKTGYQVKVWSRLPGEPSFTIKNIQDNANTKDIVINGYLIDKSYEVVLQIVDHFGEIQSSVIIPTGKALLELYKDEGVSIGKVFDPSNSSVLDIGGNVHLNGSSIFGGLGHMGRIPNGNVKNASYWAQSSFPNGVSFWSTVNNAGVTNAPSAVGAIILTKFDGININALWFAHNAPGMWRYTGFGNSEFPWFTVI